MHDLALIAPFPSLRIILLGGLDLYAEALSTFIEAHQKTLHSICLRRIRAVTGTFAPLFSLLASPNNPMQRIHLGNLSEDGRHVRFERKQISKHTEIGGDQYDNLIKRCGKDVRKQIEYSTRQGVTVGSATSYRARVRMMVEFGERAAFRN